MTLFPMTNATLGLSITRDSLCLVEVKRGLSGTRCRSIAEQQLPPDVLRLSPAKLNIENQPEFVRCLRDLLKGFSLPQPVALSLPDLCGRTTVLSFSSFPSKPAEQDSIVRWRFQQDMNLSTDKTRFSYSAFPPPPKQTGSTQVLATAVQQDIIEQYEQACLECDLLPNSVGLAGLDVFDFYQTQVHELSRGGKHRRNEFGKECLFLYLADWGFCFMAFRHGYPLFVRVKALPIPRPQLYGQHVEDSNDATRLDHQADLDPSQHGQDLYTPSDIKNVANELVATLQYYFESLQYPRDDANRIPLYFAEGIRQGDTLLPAEHQIQQMLESSMSHAPHLTMTTFSEKLTPKMKYVISHSAPQMASFSAVASVMALS